MIIAPTTCYFMLKTEGEAAVQMVSEISPGSSSDISSAILVSADFESDLYAINSLTKAIAHIQERTPFNPDDTVTEEKYNPLYIPGDMALIDDVLNLDPRTDGIRFVGMNGNPFIVKTVEITEGEVQIIAAKVEYRAFDIPGYSELVASRDPLKLN